MYTTDHIFPVLSIKHLVNNYDETNMQNKLSTSTKPSVSNLHDLVFPCVVQKSTANVDTKNLNMCHHSQKFFCDTFVGIPQHQKWFCIDVTITRKIASHEIVFEETLYLCIRKHITSGFRGTRCATSSLVYSVRYIKS